MVRLAVSYGAIGVNSLDLDLNGDWNKARMPHRGRHPHVYHEFVLRKMKQAAKESGGNVELFLKLFDNYVKQPVINNPLLLRKAGW